jgi:pilus assembly protein CpaC
MTGKPTIHTIPILLCALFVLCGLCSICHAEGGSATINRTTPVERLTLAVGQSVTIDTNVPIKWIAGPDNDKPEEAVVEGYTMPRGLASKQVYLRGRNPGTATVTLWDTTNRIVSPVYEVEVVPDVGVLKTRLHSLFPNEKGISVTATHESLTLSGSVSGTETMAQIIALASTYAPLDKAGKPRLTNLLQVAGVQQVMLEVRVSEMSRTLTRRLGINFSVLSASGQQLGLSMLNNLVKLPSEGWPGHALSVSDNVSGILRFLGGGASWTVFIDALKENGLVKVLAEPTLITLSGKPANFLAGGEYPIPIPQSGVGSTTITIEYKPFGVGLAFTPTVLNNGRINMVVAPEVSELDFTQAVVLQGYIVPSLKTRRLATTVELADGQSFAIAGLISENMREGVRKFPVLGDMPVLGALFRSSSFTKNETELVVIVTPHLVKPLDMTKQTLPTDSFSEPNDFEFYLEGRLEGRVQPGPSSGLPRSVRKGGLEGEFGHIIP